MAKKVGSRKNETTIPESPLEKYMRIFIMLLIIFVVLFFFWWVYRLGARGGFAFS